MRAWLWTQLADVLVSFGLLLLGTAGVAWECAAPGWIVPGVLGLVMAVLALAALPKIVMAWVLLAIALGVLLAGARFGRIWIVVAWAAAALTSAGLRWGVELPESVFLSVLFAVFAGFLAKLAHQAALNKKI